jgi:alpha-amylase
MTNLPFSPLNFRIFAPFFTKSSMIQRILGAVALCGTLLACQQPTGTVPTTASKTPFRPTLPEWAKNAVLYECNVRQFSPSGDFKGVMAQLPRLKELGMDILWLMPIHPIGVEKRKGSLGSPYSVMDFKAVNPDLGTEQELMQLVQQAHQLGMKVILDWVPNHTSWDAVWKKTHPEYYTRYKGGFTVPLNEKGEPIADWADICDLEFSNPTLRKAMIDAMGYWVKTCDIDGFRCDMAGLVDKRFWREAGPALDSIKPLFMLSEWQDEPDHFNSAFHFNYAWKWKDVTRDIAAGKQNAISLDTLKVFLDSFYPAGYQQMLFTLNHDENTWSGTESDLYGQAADIMNVLAFTMPGIPMLYNGQEDELRQRLKFFDRDPIRWTQYQRTPFFQTLCNLRHDNAAIWSGNYGGSIEKFSTSDDINVYAFGRNKGTDRVVVVANLCKSARTVTVQLGKGYEGAYANVFGSNTLQLTGDLQLTLQPWEYLVLSNK